jgi:hypothetical protein
MNQPITLLSNSNSHPQFTRSPWRNGGKISSFPGFQNASAASLSTAKLEGLLVYSRSRFVVDQCAVDWQSPPLWIRCLWDKFVLDTAGSKKRERASDPTFAVQQFKKMCSELQSLGNKPFLREASTKQLKSILHEYVLTTVVLKR